MNRIKETLLNHGVIAFPTETVCGLGIAYDDVIAFEKLNKIKGKRENKPYTLMLANKEEISKYAYIDEVSKILIDNFMPGDITLLLKAKEDLPDYVTANSGIVGIRVSSFDLVMDIISTFSKPLLVPSLNRSNEPPYISIEEAKKEFKEEIDLYIEGNALGKKPSTIVKCYDKIEIVRSGDIKEEEIFKVIGEKI